ncbi:cysteine hydrolase [Gordonia rubripertincta]|uniref:cysteine hydrolase n=1 Tax=Gordonia rubripertincta TaxID=36822 RepID=UPI000B8D89EE|nr:cysteine hydrolase [Gordonia rubripertincta]ASR03114.1 Isochorismatase family protein YecD [Gordonia rubripertincta]
MTTGDDSSAATAVLCVECQNGVLGPDAVLPALGADSTILVDTLARLLCTARSSGIQVIHATHEGNVGARIPGTARLWRSLGPATAHWEHGTPETQVVSALFDTVDLVVPRHHGLFPTLDTELIPVLRGHGIATVVLVGVSLNVALPFTAGHLSQSGFRVVVPRDAVAGTPPEYAEMALRHSIAMVADLTTTDKLITHWSSR